MSSNDSTEELFREYKERLTRFARHLLGSSAEIEDLVQETFLRAHRHLSGGGEIRAPLSFLFVTMRNLASDAGRQKRNEPFDTFPDIDGEILDEEVPSAEQRAMSERELERLCIAIGQLPERMRYAFVLRKVYGYSCHEIAELLGRSVNTVREQVAQSFKRLRAMETHIELPKQDRGQRAREVIMSGAEEEHDTPGLRVARVVPRESIG